MSWPTDFLWQVLVAPSDGELLAALQGAFRKYLHRPDVDQRPFLAEARELAEGCRSWDVLGEQEPPLQAVVTAAWWTDCQARRHWRLTGFVQVADTNSASGIQTSTRPALAQVYPYRTLFKTFPGEPVSFAVCDCGAVGTIRELQWMGDRCGTCHELSQSERQELQLEWATDQDGVQSISFRADGRQLAALGWSPGPIRIWDVASGRCLGRIPADSREGRFTAIRLAADGAILATSDPWGQQAVLLWDVPTATQIGGLGNRSEAPLITWAADGSTLAVVEDYRRVQVWDPWAAHERCRLPAACFFKQSVAFSPDGDTLAVSDLDGISLWQWKSEKKIANIQVGEPWGARYWTEARFTPDGQILAVWSSCLRGGSNDAMLWEMATGRETVLRGHTEPIADLAFAPDQRQVATLGTDQTIRVWDSTNGQELLRLEWQGRGLLHELAFSADGKQVLVPANVGETGWAVLRLDWQSIRSR